MQSEKEELLRILRWASWHPADWDMLCRDGRPGAETLKQRKNQEEKQNEQ